MKHNSGFYMGWAICILFCLLFWVNVIGVIRYEVWLRRLDKRPHITVWTYLTPEDIATLQADGAKEVILHGWAELEEVDWTAREDTTLAEEE